ncbi:MAG: response regulator [Deltaproteobacteria bacterium]|nr:response regulator [Deltaproteobacteria bacterium]
MSADELKAHILVVDDNPTNIDLLVDALRDEYRLGIAKNGIKALAYAQQYLPDLILLDIMMPELDGYDVCIRLKKDRRTREIPVIFITALTSPDQKIRAFEVGGVDYITKPFHASEVLARVRIQLSLKKMTESLNNQNILLEQKVQEKTTALQEMLNATIKTMALAVEIRDPYTAGHQAKVAQLASAIGKKMDVSVMQLNSIRFAGELHDIGKIRIPEAIINRPGKLLDLEREMIKIHPQIGYDLLKNIPFPWPIADIVLQHHEKLDGSGYPNALKGDQILFEAKILTVADITEAESSHRPYRPTRGLENTLSEIVAHRGRLYDADVVDACWTLFKKDGFTFSEVNGYEIHT